MSAESTTSDPYEVVLADLRAKKEQIEQAISAIEAIRSGASVSATQSPGAPAAGGPNIDIDSPGAFLGMSIVDAAKKLLAAKRQPLKNPDITAAFKRGGLVLTSKDPVNTVGSVLTRRANEVGDLVKVARGTWGLKEWYPGRSFKNNRPGTEGTEGAAAAAPTAPDNHAGEVEGNVASVAFMITQSMREELREKGVTDEEIRSMTPDEAHRRLFE